jgi:hypothetical protein
MPDHEENQDEAQHGGKRSGAGRPRGSVNRRTSALREAIEAECVDPAIALVRIGKAAEAREDFGLAVEAYGKVIPYLHARPRTSADFHAEEALEFAKAMLAAKIEAAAETLDNPTLADRLRRAKEKASITILMETGVPRAPDDLIDITPAQTSQDARHGAASPSAGHAPAQAASAIPAPAPYVPIARRADPPPPASADWGPPAAPWPDRPAVAAVDYSPFDDATYPGGLAASRNS